MAVLVHEIENGRIGIGRGGALREETQGVRGDSVLLRELDGEGMRGRGAGRPYEVCPGSTTTGGMIGETIEGIAETKCTRQIDSMYIPSTGQQTSFRSLLPSVHVFSRLYVSPVSIFYNAFRCSMASFLDGVRGGLKTRILDLIFSCLTVLKCLNIWTVEDSSSLKIHYVIICLCSTEICCVLRN